MKLFHVSRPGVKITQGLSIDPGLASTGLCRIYRVGGKLNIVPSWLEKTEAPLSVALPQLIEMCDRQAHRTLDALKELNLGETEVVIEYPHLGGEFSVGLCTYINQLTNVLWNKAGVARITFLPARIPEYFCKQRKQVTGTETVALVKSLLPGLPGRFPTHAADAALFTLFRFYDSLPAELQSRLRKPEYELVELKYHNY